MIRELKRRNARGLSLVRKDLFREGVKGACGLSNSAMREFGGWHEAVRAAGLQPVPHGYTMLKFPRAEDLIRAIKRFDAKGIPLTKTAILEEPMGCALWHGALREFGGWRKAVVAAGLEPVQMGYKQRKYRDAKAVIQGLWTRKAQGLPMTSNAPAKDPSKHDRALCRGAVREFGTWKKALEAAHITLPPARRYPDARSVIRGLRKRKAEGLSLRAKDVLKGVSHRDCSLYLNAIREFVTWRAALSAAGLEIHRSGPKRTFADAPAVLRELRSRIAKGLSLKSSVNSKLYCAVRREFGLWGKAVEAARAHGIR